MGGMYFEWSLVSDTLVTRAMTGDELRAYVFAEYGAPGLEGLGDRVARADASGTSTLDGDTLRGTVRFNRAGPDGSTLSLEQFEAQCLRGEPPALAAFAYAPPPGAEPDAEPGEVTPVVAYCALDAATLFEIETDLDTEEAHWVELPADALLLGPDAEPALASEMVGRGRCVLPPGWSVHRDEVERFHRWPGAAASEAL